MMQETIESESYDQNQNFSSDLMDDASSSSSSSSSPSSPSSPNGPLYHLSDLMDQLPIKRGLSKFYRGKSESFARLASVEKLEDLVKRENPYRRRIKLSNNSSRCSPKATIAKKTRYDSTSRGCFTSSKLGRNNTTNLISTFMLQDY